MSISISPATPKSSLPALDRSGQAPDRRRPQGGLRRSRQETRQGASGDGRAIEDRCDDRLGFEPDHDRADVRRSLRRDQGRGLVGGRHRDPAVLDASAVGFQEALSVEWRFRRCRHRLQSAGLARRGARQQEAGPLHRRVRRRRRLHVQSRHAVDGGASQDSDALHRPQQSRLSPGIHVPRGDGGAARPRRRQDGYRHHDQGSEYRLRHYRARHGRPWRRPDHRSEGSWRRRCTAPSVRQSRRDRPWSTSSPIRVEEHCNEQESKHIAVAAFARRRTRVRARSAAAQAQDAPPAGDAANGKRIFLADGCFTCHGRSGQGGAYNGPAPILAHTALPFDGFKGQVRNPADDMPAFSDCGAFGPGHRRYLRVRAIAAWALARRRIIRS